MGKREIGQLSVFDFAILLVIADILVTGLTDDHFWIFVLCVVALTVIQKLLALVMLKWVKIRNIIEGKQSIIVYDGKLNIKEMKKQNYNLDDLLVQVRLKNISSLSEVRYVILETNGEISIYRYENNNNNESESAPTRSQAVNIFRAAGGSDSLNNNPSQEVYPFPVILSGKLNTENINLLGLDETWVVEEARKQGKDIKDIYYGNYEYGGLFIIETKDI
jgi:uncharacterized membrane protein YcaP (DUF421 family)